MGIPKQQEMMSVLGLIAAQSAPDATLEGEPTFSSLKRDDTMFSVMASYRADERTPASVALDICFEITESGELIVRRVLIVDFTKRSANGSIREVTGAKLAEIGVPRQQIFVPAKRRVRDLILRWLVSWGVPVPRIAA